MGETAGTADPRSLSRDEIVVAASHAQRVVDLVGKDYAGVVEVNPQLGLARVALVDLETVAERFAPVVAEAVRNGRVPAMRADTPLEQVIAGVRVTCSSEWAGWVPRMGKNRVMLLGGESLAITIPRSDGFPDNTASDKGPLLHAADVPAAQGDAGQRVAVGLLDTAVRRGLSLDGRLHAGSTVLDDADTWTAAQGHGTFTAGLVHQAAPGAQVRVRGVLGGRGTSATAWEVAVALVDLVKQAQAEREADPSLPPLCVVNMSLGCFTEDGRPPLVLDTAVSMVRDDVVLVAAAGNHGGKPDGGFPSPVAPLWPAALDGVVAVGGRVLDGHDQVPSDFTPRAPWVDLLADGSDVISDYLVGDVAEAGNVVTFDGAARWTGGSMAAATAAGRIATLGHDARSIRSALRKLLTTGGPDPDLTVFAAPRKP